MGRTFLVDAHNALFRLSSDPPRNADAVRRSVVLRAQSALRATGLTDARVHLVFDTAEAGRTLAGTHGREGAVTWSYARGSADEEIVRLVRQHDGRDADGPLTVVTDDRELRGRASQLGARVVRVHDWFDARPASPAGGDRPSARVGPPLTPADFGLTDAPIDLLRTDPDDL
ncbi:MAG: NYN domain-containing protein [Planctomycetia bacterium]|nr:NYN domain-containing protein [Planctomycetia bacterium]